MNCRQNPPLMSIQFAEPRMFAGWIEWQFFIGVQIGLNRFYIVVVRRHKDIMNFFIKIILWFVKRSVDIVTWNFAFG